MGSTKRLYYKMCWPISVAKIRLNSTGQRSTMPATAEAELTLLNSDGLPSLELHWRLNNQVFLLWPSYMHRMIRSRPLSLLFMGWLPLVRLHLSREVTPDRPEGLLSQWFKGPYFLSVYPRWQLPCHAFTRIQWRHYSHWENSAARRSPRQEWTASVPSPWNLGAGLGESSINDSWPGGSTSVFWRAWT